jgi:hypothetical protein
MVWSWPALGLAVTFIKAVSLQPFNDQNRVYVPTAVSPDTDVVGDVAFENVTTDGLPGAAIHVPVPTAAIVAVEYWQVA